ncbi:hypothetical protein GU3_14145 [Oceanimonas sp. GK1]|uniref:hypothetical protein n=1 Tax=Oceanimonas sp. (strain GK1 / IBRC-M 10197) TaxID=511062 RepID=UPI0002494E74|nr:hypothetical protein [Oceanimonas sp. GK1]AEY02582.1 hypothetical protein GU3_14145 [Oceanimonas sp. GK1]
MRKFSTLMIALTTTLMLPQAALALDAKTPARVCLSTANMGTDGVDLHQAKLAARRAGDIGSGAPQCVPARVFLNGGSNGTDGVDRLRERMTKQASGGAADPGFEAEVYFSKNTNGTDGVDLLQRRLAGDA